MHKKIQTTDVRYQAVKTPWKAEDRKPSSMIANFVFISVYLSTQVFLLRICSPDLAFLHIRVETTLGTNWKTS